LNPAKGCERKKALCNPKANVAFASYSPSTKKTHALPLAIAECDVLQIIFFRIFYSANREQQLRSNACVCLCSGSISGAGNNFLPSLQRRGAFAQGLERTESPSWVVGQSPTRESVNKKK